MISKVPMMLSRGSEGEGLLSQDLIALRRQAKEEALTLAQLEEALQGRGFAVLIVLITLPFIVPVSIPGLSIPFGLLLSFMGLRVAIGKNPWLPKWCLHRKLAPAWVSRVLGFGVKLALWMEKFARPRALFLHSWPGMVNLIGVVIMINGFLLILPPPAINTLPALSIILVTVGLMERDGVIVLGGYLMSIVSVGYIVLLGFIGKIGFEGITRLWE